MMMSIMGEEEATATPKPYSAGDEIEETLKAPKSNNKLATSTPVPPSISPSQQDLLSHDQDEDEMKRERRKRLNRESARRSRLRKREEADRLQTQTKRPRREALQLKNKLMSLSKKCLALADENKTILEELEGVYGPEAVAELREKYNELVQGRRSSHIQDPNGDTSPH